MGHTMSIHSRNEAVILEFGLHKPAYRIVVNTPTTHGSIGLTTGLDPAMTLGCGGFGGNITSDNISPRHLLNIKRLAYGIREVPDPRARVQAPGPRTQDPGPALPKAPPKPAPDPVSAATLYSRIDSFLASRGVSRPAADRAQGSAPTPSPAPAATPLAFVCEDDVRVAIREGRTLLVNERTIITPAARDAGEAGRVFVWPGLRS
jgi:hypothetical protein